MQNFKTLPAPLAVGNYNDSWVDANSITSTRAVFSYRPATGGTGNYTYIIYLEQGTFSLESVDRIENEGFLVVQVQAAGNLPLVGLNPGTHYSVVAIVDEGNMKVPYYVQQFNTPPDTGSHYAPWSRR